MTRNIADFLATRRSVKPDKLASPGPTPDQLRDILTTAARVPDHKKQVPWRFLVFTDAARQDAGEIFATAAEREDKAVPSPMRLETERNRFLRAPVVVAVISSFKQRPGVPEWEQILSAGAVCFNLCLAANARGYASNWLTEWIAYSPYVREQLGLVADERIAGFIYLGSATEPPAERDRPDMDAIIRHWGKS